jgi:PTH2 family peptidyl-tRNA hydrolase
MAALCGLASSVKQVILVNETLSLPPGKLAAQVAHASMASYLESTASAQAEWLQCGMPKIVLSVATEEELLVHYNLAVEANLPASLIKDAGRTVVQSGTLTSVGIGPADPAKIDQITGALKLLD